MRHALTFGLLVLGLACSPSSGPRDLSPDALDFAVAAPQGASVSQTLGFAGATPDLDLFVATGDETWLTYSVTTKDDLPALEVTADSSGMSQGDYSAALDISAAG